MRKRTLPPARVIGVEAQPLNQIHWIPREQLHANQYNPNHVSPAELELLRVSLLEDGWTQPIVARRDLEIVDGFHRWTLSGEPEIGDMTSGLVPVVFLIEGLSKDHQIMSTIRHNRARGAHAVLKMADIVRNLIDQQGLSREEVMQRLQMDKEEVERLYDRSGMKGKGSRDEFNSGWVPQ